MLPTPFNTLVAPTSGVPHACARVGFGTTKKVKKDLKHIFPTVIADHLGGSNSGFEAIFSYL